MKNVFLLICLFSFITSISQKIPEDFLKTVGFIYRLDSLGNHKLHGTGFYVCIEDSTENSGKVSGYMVTAKHILKYKEKDLDELYIRLNRNDSLAETRRLPLRRSGLKKNVFTHRDSTVDIAVIQSAPKPEDFDYKCLSETFLTDKNDVVNMNIGPGTKIFFTGLFNRFDGNKRIYPMTRFGRVSMLPEERIPWIGEMTELYLFETFSFGGNSGSPVYFDIAESQSVGTYVVGGPSVRFAGVMLGYFGNGREIGFVETKSTPVSYQNTGIAAIAPSYLLKEILYSDELKSIRGY